MNAKSSVLIFSQISQMIWQKVLSDARTGGLKLISICFAKSVFKGENSTQMILLRILKYWLAFRHLYADFFQI